MRVVAADAHKGKWNYKLVADLAKQYPQTAKYAILVREINSNTNELSGVTIYDYTIPAKINVVTADKGKIYFTADQKNLVMDLWRGETHEADVKDTGLYRKLIFTKHRIVMDGSQFSFHQSQGGIRGERELGVDTMKAIVSNFRAEREQQIKFLKTETNKFFLTDSSFITAFPNHATAVNDKLVLARVLDKIRTAKNNITSKVRSVEFSDREIEKYEVEIYKKYAIPAACIVFILIGAPLGVMVKKAASELEQASAYFSSLSRCITSRTSTGVTGRSLRGGRSRLCRERRSFTWCVARANRGSTNRR